MTISAKYFSPFANVSVADCRDVKGTFGTQSSKKWKPWNYPQRINVVNKVKAFKKRVALEKISEKSKRSKVTDFIAKQNSRQEFVPLLGSYIHLIKLMWNLFILKIMCGSTFLKQS